MNVVESRSDTNVSEKSENSAKDDECLSDQLEGEIKEETINGEVQLETKKEKKVKFVSEISLQNGAEKEKLNIDREQLVKVNPKNFVQRKKKFYPKDQLSKVNWESFTLVRKNMNGVIETTQSCEKTVGNEEKGNNTYENRQFQNGNGKLPVKSETGDEKQCCDIGSKCTIF